MGNRNKNFKNNNNNQRIKIKNNSFQLLIKINLIFFILFSLIIFPIFADTKSDILEVINNNYIATKNADVDAYIKTMDTNFLKVASPDYFSYKDYYKGTFEIIETVDYNINEPKLELMPNSALLFYNLKGTLKNKETNEIKKIDNDVVTFLYNYNGDWKIRWTLTQSLYQLKAEAGLLSEVAVDMTLNDLDNNTLKEKAIKVGTYTQPEDELLINNENRDEVNPDYKGVNIDIITDITDDSDSNNNYNNNDNNHSTEYNSDSDSSFSWFFFILILIVIYYFYNKSKKNKTKNNKNLTKNKNIQKSKNKNTKKEKEIKNNGNNKNNKPKEKIGIGQKILGKMFEIQEQLKEKELQLDKKTGLTKEERDIQKYYRDKSFNDDLNRETEVVDSDSDGDKN